VRLPPKNVLDQAEQVTLFEVAGMAGRHVFRGERFDPFNKAFEAEPGDLVLVCRGSEAPDPALPAGWGERALHSGFAVALARPPLIVDKTSFQPIHVTSAVFYWAIQNVKWKWPGQNVLASIEIGRALGDGRWEIPSHNKQSWVLEVPATLKNRVLLVPGRYVWAILGEQRFDAALRKLVLVARDFEPTYIFEKTRRF
jgi:hypothetical protein